MVDLSFLSDLETVRRELGGKRLQRHLSPPIWVDDLARIDREFLKATAISTDKARALLEAHRLELADSPIFNSVSLFQALGFYRHEVSHTNALSWLLDCRAPHGFGNRLFLAFLRAIKPPDSNDNPLFDIVEAGSSLEVHRVLAEWPLSPSCRVDIFAEGRLANGTRWCLLVEAKVDALERPSQTSEYAATFAAKNPSLGPACVFLTPDGREAMSKDTAHSWASLSFLTLARQFLRELPTLEGLPGTPFLKLYVASMLQDICGVRGGSLVEDVLRRNNPYQIEQLLGPANVNG